MDWLFALYPWIKALHLIAVIAWMAGMLYLPRLFVYHADVPVGSPQSETFKVMERRLLKGIVNPAMIAVFVLGALLLWIAPIDWSSGWIWLKLVCVAGLGGLHGSFAKWRKDFGADRNTRPARTFRLANELPMVLAIVIVIMVIVKPF